MKFRSCVALVLLAAGLSIGTSPARADDRRFSTTLDTAELSAAGLGRLSSDQTAILDALVRREAAKPAPAADVPAARFSDRLSAGERLNAGLTSLTGPELVALDHRVDQYLHPIVQKTAAMASMAPDQSALTSVQVRRALEIHGSISFMVGAGSHGYSEYGGGMDVSVYDPDHHIAVEAGYAEFHSSGGLGGRWCGNRRIGAYPER